MTAILSSLWPLITGLAVAVPSLLYALFKHQQTKQAETDAAKAQSDAAAVVANKQAEVEAGNAAASAAEARAVEVAQSASQSTASVPDADLDAELDKLGALRKD
jgi:hypothetical protein